MPCSMTGMGKAVNRGQGVSIEVEIKSVNNRYLLIKSHLPEAVMQYDPRLHRVIRKQIKRGTVDLYIRVAATSRDTSVRINRLVLSEYIDTLRKVKKKEKLSPDMTPELFLSLPGVIESKEKTEIPTKIYALIEEATRDATERLYKMRATEGRRLLTAIVKHKSHVEKLLTSIGERINKSLEERINKLKTRIADLLKDQVLSPEDPTLQREIAVLVDRSDFTEEIDRLRSHLVQFDKVIDSDEEMGRQLDFLLQEMGREVNTIGSKACDAAISFDVVKMKAELEKIREQVQNIE
ncbi:MAG: YicC/YloC family endoribonuclease [Planctomycetota bacterium]